MEEEEVKCDQTETECDNEDMRKCVTCAAPLLCLCRRPDVIEKVKKLWMDGNLVWTRGKK